MDTLTATAPAAPNRLDRLAQALLVLCLLGAVLFFYTGTKDQFELPKQLLLRGLSSLWLGLLLHRILTRPAEGWRRGPVDGPVLLWAAALLLGTFTSVAPWLSWRGEYENFAGSLTQLNYVALYFASVQFLREPEDARRILRALLAAALGAALYALLQALQRDFMGWAAASVVADRFFGPLGNPNFLGGLMAMAIPLRLALSAEQAETQGSDPEWGWRLGMLGLLILTYLAAGKAPLLAFWTPRPGAHAGAAWVLGFWLLALVATPLLARRKLRLRHLPAAADLLLLATALANTGTRGAFLGLLLGLATLALTWAARRGRARLRGTLLSLLAAGLLLGLAFAGLGSSFRQRMWDSLRRPVQALEVSRLQIWIPALKMWQEHPLLGTGVDSFKAVFPRYSLSRFNRYDGENVSSRMAHCEILQVAATQGSVGLLVWLGLLAAWVRAWVNALRARKEPEASLLGVGGLVAAYLGQNLVSFGVAGISVPFWVALAVPAAFMPERRQPLPWKPQPAALSALAGSLVALLGLHAVRQNFDADRLYALATQAQAQAQSSPSLGYSEALGGAVFAYRALATDQNLPADERAELETWRRVLAEAEDRRSRGEALDALLPAYRAASAALLQLLGARSMEQALSWCPHEVKYHVYAGLSYEELFRLTDPQRRGIWFQRSEAAYQRSVELNPANAYYRGNLGRLYSLAAEAAGPSAGAAHLERSLESYAQAIERAPSTRLFYENLLLLCARHARLETAAQTLQGLAARDPELAPDLLVAAAGTFLQAAGEGDPVWTGERRQEARRLCLTWVELARSLAPEDAQIAAAAAGIQAALGRNDEARRNANAAIALDPKDRSLRERLRGLGLLP
jgi:tetratricopeptide (TPR) repeat protein